MFQQLRKVLQKIFFATDEIMSRMIFKCLLTKNFTWHKIKNMPTILSRRCISKSVWRDCFVTWHVGSVHDSRDTAEENGKYHGEAHLMSSDVVHCVLAWKQSAQRNIMTNKCQKYTDKHNGDTKDITPVWWLMCLNSFSWQYCEIKSLSSAKNNYLL